MVVIVTCQGAQIHRLKFGCGRSPASVGVRAESSLRLGSWMEPGFRGSPGGALSELKLRAEPGSRRSPGGIPCNQNQMRSPAPVGVRTKSVWSRGRSPAPVGVRVESSCGLS